MIKKKNLRKFKQKHSNNVVTECGNPDFDWSAYDDGWNGKSLKRNEKINTVGTNDIVYSHETYANASYKRLKGITMYGQKDLEKNILVSISDINVIDDDYISLSINGGSNNVIVDMNKENKFLNQFTVGENNTPVNKSTFMELMKTDFKNQLLGMNINAKLTAGDPEKASIWDGYVETLAREMKEQITKKNKAYYGTIVSTNRGGFYVDIMNTITAFMPGSLAASNRITDFDSMIGKKFEVMVEAYDPGFGFIVSRKKYLRTLLPHEIDKLQEQFDVNPEMQITGRVTGTTKFGVFIEINEFITGMLHKTLVDDEVRQMIRDNSIEDGSMFTAYIHKIDGTRVILSNVPLSERDAIIAKREAEEAEEDRLKELAAQQALEENDSVIPSLDEINIDSEEDMIDLNEVLIPTEYV